MEFWAPWQQKATSRALRAAQLKGRWSNQFELDRTWPKFLKNSWINYYCGDLWMLSIKVASECKVSAFSGEVISYYGLQLHEKGNKRITQSSNHKETGQADLIKLTLWFQSHGNMCMYTYKCLSINQSSISLYICYFSKWDGHICFLWNFFLFEKIIEIVLAKFKKF